MKNEHLVIDVLRNIASLPNSFDREVLNRIQDNIACDVMKLHRSELVGMLERQQKEGLPAVVAEQQRKAFFVDKLNGEYRRRAGNASAFSLPFYLEAAENHYRMEIRRLLQKTQDCIAQGRSQAEIHMANSVRELRMVDRGVNTLANQVAQNLNSINDALEKLSRIRTQAADRATSDLKNEMHDGFLKMRDDSFSISMLTEVQMLASAHRGDVRFENDEAPSAKPH